MLPQAFSADDLARQFSATSKSKLERSAVDLDYAIQVGVTPVATAEDLPPEFASLIRVCPAPGMLFPWKHPLTGEKVWQYRPDHPVEDHIKYMFPEGMHQPLGLIREARGDQRRVVIVEGTLQSLAFARYAPDDVAVYAIPGCWGWSHDGNPTPSLEVVNGYDVIVFLDADAATNPDVYAGGEALAKACRVFGANEVFFGHIPARGTSGVDDFLGKNKHEARAGLVARLLEQVDQKPASTKPARKKSKARLGEGASAGLPEVNDMALGTGWADKHKGEFRWLTDQEQWLKYRDGRWARVGGTVTGASVMRYLNDVAGQYFHAANQETDEEKKEKILDIGRGLLSNSKRGAVQATAANYDELHVTLDQADKHPNLWCAANCVIDLETGEVRDHDPKLLLTRGSDIPYIPDAECPRFDRFLAEVQPDKDMRDFLLRVFAMAMWGEVHEHVLPVFIGSGRNGKGTLLSIMQQLFGDYSSVINSKALLKRKFEAHEEEVAELFGRRLVTAQETGKDAEWDVARVNSWTGDDVLTGRPISGNRFYFKPSHTLIMATNHRPNVGQGETAFWARYREVPFEVSFEGREDQDLKKIIIGHELPGVLNRLLEAGREYIGLGKKLSPPATVIVATESAKMDSDHMARFVLENLEKTDKHDLDRITNTEIYERFQKWWSQNVEGQTPPGKRTFTGLLKTALRIPNTANNPKKIGKGSASRLTWTGVRWREDGDTIEGLEPPLGFSELRNATWQTSGVITPTTEQTQGLRSGNPNQGSAELSPESAQWSAKLVDHGDGVTAGQDLSSAKSAKSAKSGVWRGKNTENTSETRSTHSNGVTGESVFPISPTHRGKTQQTWQTSQIAPSQTQVMGVSQERLTGTGLSAADKIRTVDKVPCSGCGKLINAAGANKRDGLCGRCYTRRGGDH